jgi:dinuclear metal center YbgI/SA1388 family protein
MSLPLARAVDALAELSPLRYAESWDNVGLLLGVASSEPAVSRALFTIDLSDAVLTEAIERRVELVVAYHPPLFGPVRRLDAQSPATRVLLRAARAGIAIFSPHTALDAAPGGVNDWLAQGLGEGELEPLVDAAALDREAELKLVTFVPAEAADRLRAALSAAGAGNIGDYSECSSQVAATGTFLGSASANPAVGQNGRLETVAELRLEMVCPRGVLGRVARVMRDVHPYEEPAWDVYPLAPRPTAGYGMGRALTLAAPATLAALVARLKIHVGRATLRVAASAPQRDGAPIRRIAVCAGSGKSVFEGTRGFDAYVTGELSHHAVLAHLAAGSSVILCEHSTSERGYLPAYAARFAERTGGAVETLISAADREPLESW